jgi:hypothetical protein
MTTICQQRFTSANGNAQVQALRLDSGFAIRIYWPAGFDNAPTVKRFTTDAEAIAAYVTACEQLQTRYKFVKAA